MDIEVEVTWDMEGLNREPHWEPSSSSKSNPVRQAIELLLESNTTVTLRDDEHGCTLIYRKMEED